MKVILKNVRIAFCNTLFVAEQYQGAGAFRHSSTFLIEPGSANDKAVRKAIEESAASAYDKRAAQVLKGMENNSNKFCYMSGDLKEYDGFAGMMALTSHRKGADGAPLVIDKNKSPLSATSGKLYGGCYVNASVEIYAQNGENVGMRCGLIAVQFFADGDSFGGASKAKLEDFDDLSSPEDDLA